MTRVALLGFGTVGSAVARRLVAPAAHLHHVQLTHVFDRRPEDKRRAFGSAASGVTFTSRFDEILASDADIVIELVGGVDPAASWIRSALLAGKSVVTANKQVVALHGAELWRLAANQGRQFRFEAAVGGAMPIVRAIADGLAGDRIVRIDAILNGTTNAVLSQMEATGCSFAAALADARVRGFAEADPSADVDGDDARAKLAILAGLAFGVRLNPSHIPGHSSAAVTVADIDAARRHGRKIRQIAHADYDYERATLTAWVAPVPVNDQSIFARTTGASNAAVITGAHCGEIGIFGAGAGGDATAVAVVSDIAAIARDRAAVVPPPALTSTFCLLNSPFELREAV